jgi:hypothetical protein
MRFIAVVLTSAQSFETTGHARKKPARLKRSALILQQRFGSRNSTGVLADNFKEDGQYQRCSEQAADHDDFAYHHVTPRDPSFVFTSRPGDTHWDWGSGVLPAVE